MGFGKSCCDCCSNYVYDAEYMNITAPWKWTKTKPRHCISFKPSAARITTRVMNIRS